MTQTIDYIIYCNLSVGRSIITNDCTDIVRIAIVLSIVVMCNVIVYIHRPGHHINIHTQTYIYIYIYIYYLSRSVEP